MARQLTQPRHRGLVTTDFRASGSVAMVAGVFQEWGRVTLLAGQGLALGWGHRRGQDDAEGRIFARMQATAVVVDGTIRMSAYSPDNRLARVLGEWRTERLRNVILDNPTTHVPLPVISDFVLPFAWSLVCEFNPAAPGTITVADTVMRLDCTAFTVSPS